MFTLSGMLSPRTKMGWLRGLRLPISFAASSFAYAVPALWGLWLAWPLQAFLSFMSDYYATGRDSWWHVADRCCARVLSVAMVCWAVISIGWVQAGALSVASFGFYALSVRAIGRRDFDAYVRMHTLWHVVGGASNAYVMSSICDWSAGAACTQREWVDLLTLFRCRCIKDIEGPLALQSSTSL